MQAIQAAAHATEILAAASAGAAASRRAEHVPAAAALVALTAIHGADAAIVAHLPTTTDPLSPTLYPFVYADGAAVLASIAIPAGLTVAASVAPARRARVVVLVATVWALASLALAIPYPSPSVRGTALQELYLRGDLAGLFVSMVTLILWARQRTSPTTSHVIAIGLMALDIGILIVPYSPWRTGLLAGRWDVVQVGCILFFAAFTAWQVWLWRSASRSTSS